MDKRERQPTAIMIAPRAAVTSCGITIVGSSALFYTSHHNNQPVMHATSSSAARACDPQPMLHKACGSE